MNILSAGAARGLLQTVATHAGIELVGEFGAVGAMRERLDSGAACDVIVLTEKTIAELAALGIVDAGSVIALGKVRTGVALPAAAAPTRVDTAAELKNLLASASRIYFPDPERATAGIHFMKVLKTLGLAESHRDRFATFPNGAAAMRAMAAAGDVRAVGVTQCSEILYTEGVQLVGALPGEFELATVYAAAITTKATADGRRDATRLLTALANADNAATRSGAGFEAIDW
jgi:molybdate transport system substrate-binding protein